ncbi:MAG: PAS domain-containing protein [Acidisphaera sp.]|nr:PAS domain-containing protein [Acidisphaera sp.]
MRVLTGLPEDAGLAVVLALQHREAMDEESLRRALGERAGALVPVADGVPLEAGRIFLPASDVIVTLNEGRFRTRSAEREQGGRAIIDSLFLSMATDGDGHAIGLVLAGTGADGTLGVAAIKEAGGFTLAEAEEGTGAAELASSNSPAALVDLVLPADQLSRRIALHAQHLAEHSAADAEPQARPAEAAGALDRIATLLRERTGHDFHGYRRPTFLRRVQRRMGVLGAETLNTYLNALQTRPDEPQLLFNDLLIGVTRFFRDAREFEFLEREVVPRLFEGKGREDQVRIWVLGCSTGEEAYSIAILLREFAAKLEAPPGIQIFATDLDGRALASARAGRYKRDIAQDVGLERLARWFIEQGDTYAVSRELRDVCVFSQHSLVKDTPFSRLDLVSCRNLLIYLGPELQDRVIPLFHFALKPTGYLFLGSSEGVARHNDLFAPVDRGVRIFRRVETGRRILRDFPARGMLRAPTGIPAMPVARTADPGLVRRAERLAERHAPAYAIIDRGFDLLHLSARVGRFIHPTAGSFSPNLLDLVHPDLRLDLRGALTKAAQDGDPIRVDGVRMDMEGQGAAVDLVVEPIPDGLADNHGAPGTPRGFVVLFKDGPPPPEAGETGPGGLASAENVRRLEAELRLTRQRLQATIEELENTNEELRSSNEEYQSLNEELQSANEEMATSKEELQSLNEELTTVNHELDHRVQELARANSDLTNLLQATQIATVFLDTQLRVTNFTPTAGEVFRLVDTDLGRPIEHIKSRVAYEGLQEDVRRVLRTLSAIEREVQEPGTGVRYIARVLPYRSVDNVIAGAVVTFTDITPLARAQERLRESEARLAADLAGMRRLYELHARLASEINLKAALGEILGAACEFTRTHRGCVQLVSEDGLRLEMFAWRGYADDGPFVSHFRHKDLEQGPDAARVERRRFLIEDTRTFPGLIGTEDGAAALADGILAVQSTPMISRKGETVGILSTQFREPHRPSDDELRLIDLLAWAAADWVERHRAEAALRESEARFRQFGEASPDVLWVRDAEGLRYEYLSPAFEAIYGGDRGRVLEDGVARWAELIHPEDREAALGKLERVRQGERVTHEYRIRRPSDGEDRWLRDTDFPLFDEAGRVERLGGIGQDVTEEKDAAGRQAVLVAEIQHRTRNLMAVVRSLAEKTMAGAADLQEFRQTFRDRLLALSRVQGLLSRLTGGQRLTFDELIRAELTAIGAIDGEGRGPQVVLEGPAGVRLRTGSVQTFSLALHELATNAVKYGALSRPEGRLSVRWRLEFREDGHPVLHVDWQEHGVSVPEPEDRLPRRRGYGRELIERALPYQLKAHTHYELGPDGVNCSIAVPVSAGVTAEGSEDA